LLARRRLGYAMLLIVLVLFPVVFLLEVLLALAAVGYLGLPSARLFRNGDESSPEQRWR